MRLNIGTPIVLIAVFCLLLTWASSDGDCKIESIQAAFSSSEVWVDDDYCNGCPNDGRTWGEDAFDKIQNGIDAVPSPGTVYVAAGTYIENINFFGKAITVRSKSGAENTIIDGGGNGTVVTLESSEGLDSVLDGFTITNAEGRNNHGIRCYQGSATIINNIIKPKAGVGIALYKSTSVIRNNIIYGNPEGGFSAISASASSPIIENNTILATGPNGNTDAIYISSSEGGFRISSNIIKGRIWINLYSAAADFEHEISNNIIIIENGFSSAANINIDDPANLSIINNTILGGSIFLQRGGDRTKIINNIITDSNNGVESWSGYSDILNNDLWNNGTNYSGIPDQTGINGNMSEDPKLSGDYHLSAISPCIDAGNNNALPATQKDFEGDPRIIDGDNNNLAIVDIGADEMDPTRKLVDIFGLEVGNESTYQGTYMGVTPYTWEAEVATLDQTTFPITTYIVEYRQDGILAYKFWYEKTAGQLMRWGDKSDGDMFKYANGLVEAWYPMEVNDHMFSSVVVNAPGYFFTISLTVDVLSKESVPLSFDTIEAYKVRYRFNVEDETSTYYQWVLPYLGIVKYQDPAYVEILSAFTIGGGTINQETDADSDDLKDYQELIVYNTNWQSPDTDADNMPDGWEVSNNLDPLDDCDASEDKDGDGFKNLKEYEEGTDPNDPKSHPPRAMPWILLLLFGD